MIRQILITEQALRAPRIIALDPRTATVLLLM